MQNALKIKILSDDNFFARKVEHRLKAEDGKIDMEEVP